MSDDPGRVLVVDENYDTLDLLAKTLRSLGARVSLATDGQSGLKHAVEMHAEVVLVDRDVRVFDIRTFLDVLSDNPHTADAHVFVLGEGDPTELAALHPRAEPIVKPFHAEEVATRVMEVIRARREPETGPELEGDLQQVALFDLLQVFAANRRTGLLSVVSRGVRGQIWLNDGRVVDAVCGFVAGEKALFRVLALREGQFVFLPDRTAARQRIDASTDYLLMEAVRHADELAEIQTRLPDLATQVHCVGTPTKSVEGLSAELVARITSSLEEARSIEELLDLLPQHDLEILRIVAVLLRREVLQAYDAINRVRFCDPEEVTAMRAAALRLRRAGVEGPVRPGCLGTARRRDSFRPSPRRPRRVHRRPRAAHARRRRLVRPDRRHRDRWNEPRALLAAPRRRAASVVGRVSGGGAGRVGGRRRVRARPGSPDPIRHPAGPCTLGLRSPERSGCRAA